MRKRERERSLKQREDLFAAVIKSTYLLSSMGGDDYGKHSFLSSSLSSRLAHGSYADHREAMHYLSPSFLASSSHALHMEIYIKTTSPPLPRWF